ncbi:putative phage tail protein [Weissella cibaria]|uniref:putative phage tail protein n=1 Tax=Weissella cibaria TaxID=137591 RepID=UPI0034E88C54
MAKLIRLKELMPNYYSDVLEMNTLLEVEQYQLDEFEAAISRQQANQFVMTADTDGIAVWETLVGLNSSNSLDLETRRYNVLARMLPPKPVTIRYLRELLAMLNINAELTVNGPAFKVDVKINTTDTQATRRLNDLLSALLPANLKYTAFNIGQENQTGALHTGAGALVSVQTTNTSRTEAE